jgi:hypothetical protein
MVPAMRVSATTTSQIRAVSLVPAARSGRGSDQPLQHYTAPQAAAPVDASAAFLAQAIAQELFWDALPPEASLADAYLPRPRAAFEGLNFRAIA